MTSMKHNALGGMCLFLALVLTTTVSIAGSNRDLLSPPPPLSLEQVLQLPNLQPDNANNPAQVAPGVTRLQGKSIVHGYWQYKVEYMYDADQGWQLYSLRISPASAVQTGDEDSAASP